MARTGGPCRCPLKPGPGSAKGALARRVAWSAEADAATVGATVLPPSSPLSSFRQVTEWMRRPYEFFASCQAQFGDLFTLRIPVLGDVVIVASPEHVKEVFAQSPEAAHAGEANVVLRPFLGDHSLLLLDGSPHLRHRRMMMPAFHGDRIASYGASMLSMTDESIDRAPRGRPFAAHDLLQDLTLRIILRTVFGVAEGARFTELATILAESLDVLAWPPMLASWMQTDLGPWSPWGKFVRLSRRADALLQAEIEEARAQSAAGRSDILSMLLAARDEQGQGLTDLELKQELVTLLVAGHETTATALSWALRWTLDDVTLRDRLVAEADRLVVAGGGTLDPAAVARSELLDGVVKEALRLVPVIPLVGRVMQRPLTLGAYELPVGTRVAPSIYLVHHRPELYPHAERFDPDRYRSFRPSSWEFIPFGGGFRRCIGASFAIAEMKMVLAQLFRRLTLRLAPGYRPRRTRRSITITPSEGLPVIAAARLAS